MAGPRIRPNGMEFWPTKAIDLTPDQVQQTYEQGFCGVFFEPEERDAFEADILARGGKVYGHDIAEEFGFSDSGEGKLSIPFVYAAVFFPHCWPAAAQARGDCVAHDQRNANETTYACELQHGKPDEVSGKLEQAPKIPDRGLKQGAFSTEVYYWYRRHGGDGWSCEAAARVAMKEAGLVTRDNHPELGMDLTEYSGRNAGRWGRTPPPDSITDFTDDHLVRQATTLRTREERRDFLFNGYALSTCGMEGFSNRRDENGVSTRKGTWAHAMCFHGFDDRASTRSIYGESLELVQNSWGVWNQGPRDIRDSQQYVQSLMVATGKTKAQLIDLDIVNATTGNIMIPQGSFWARSRDVSRRTCIAKAGVSGWERRDLWLPGPFDGVI